MEGLVHRTVTKIKTACGRATKYRELRDLCDDILTKVSENNKNGKSAFFAAATTPPPRFT